MKFSKVVYENLGKTIIDIGKGFILAILVAWFLTKESANNFLVLIGFSIGVLLICYGLYLVDKSDKLKNGGGNYGG